MKASLLVDMTTAVETELGSALELWSSLFLLRVCLLRLIVTLGKVFPSPTGHLLSTGSSLSSLS